MDIVFSANLKPRPQVRRLKGNFVALFSACFHPSQAGKKPQSRKKVQGENKTRIAKKMRLISSLSYAAKSQSRVCYSQQGSTASLPTASSSGAVPLEGKEQGQNLTLHKSPASSPKLTYKGCSRAPCLVNIAENLLPYQKFRESSQKNDGYALKKALRQWLLVLEAKKVPFVSYRMGGQLRIYVPALFSVMAETEINEYSLEGTRQASFLPSRPWWFGAVCLAVCLLVWHLLRFDLLPHFSLPVPPFPAQPTEWPAAFGLDVHRTMVRGEWWRLMTSLTLHSDGRHLLSNILMGGAFFALLAGRIGFRRSFFLTLLGGALGNAVSLFFKPSAMVSIGFSTSCFVLLGILGSYVFCDTAQVRLRHKEVELLHAPRWFTPLAAGLALLAFLGGAGQPNTDFAAHASGAGIGFILGGLAWYAEQLTHGKPEIAKTVATFLFLVACLALVVSWSYGLAAFNA